MKYEIRHSRRARLIRLTVTADGAVRLTVPRFVSQRQAERFLHDKQGWLQKTLAKVRLRVSVLQVCSLPREIIQIYVEQQVRLYAQALLVSMPNVRMMKAKTRWGSCSLKTRTVAINWRLSLAPIELVNYVIAHEVVHLLHPNHSKAFWQTVSRVQPDYKILRQRLKTHTAPTPK